VPPSHVEDFRSCVLQVGWPLRACQAAVPGFVEGDAGGSSVTSGRPVLAVERIRVPGNAAWCPPFHQLRGDARGLGREVPGLVAYRRDHASTRSARVGGGGDSSSTKVPRPTSEAHQLLLAQVIERRREPLSRLIPRSTGHLTQRRQPGRRRARPALVNRGLDELRQLFISRRSVSLKTQCP